MENYKKKYSSEQNITYFNMNINIHVNSTIDYINTNKYTLLRTIYEKRNRAVYLIESKKDHHKYIMKIKSNDIDVTEKLKALKTIKPFKHPNIVQFKKYSKKMNYQYFIYKYIEGQNMGEYIKNNTLTLNDIKIIFLQIAEGIRFFHNLNIIHCDLKLDNIIVDNDKHVVITDFELSRVINSDHSNCEIMFNNLIGTIHYLAPESYNLNIYSKATDIWALGIILYFTITGQYPCQVDSVFVNNYNMYRRNDFKHINFNIIKNDKLRFIVSNMLQYEDSKRPDIETIINYDWDLE